MSEQHYNEGNALREIKLLVLFPKLVCNGVVIPLSTD